MKITPVNHPARRLIIPTMALVLAMLACVLPDGTVLEDDAISAEPAAPSEQAIQNAESFMWLVADEDPAAAQYLCPSQPDLIAEIDYFAGMSFEKLSCQPSGEHVSCLGEVVLGGTSATPFHYEFIMEGNLICGVVE